MNRLPPEIIALCATLVSPSGARPMVSLTHVCRYWRKAIASSPRNWASIGSGWKRLVPLCLERAGLVPLTAHITISDIEVDAVFLRTFLPHTSRITHLSLTGCSSIEAVANAVPSFFASTIHALTSLELQQTTDPVEFFPSGTPPAFPISWGLPKLRSLRLTRTPLYPALTSLTSLTELKLVGYTNPVHYGNLIGFFRSNPNLEVIISDIQLVEYSLWTPPSTVPFPRLRHLSFTYTNALDARALILSVSFPQGVHLEVVGPRVNPSIALTLLLSSHTARIWTPITTIKYQDEPGAVQLYGNSSRFSFWCQSPFQSGYSEFSRFATTAVRELHMKISSCHDLSQPLSQVPALETLVLVDVSSFQPLAFLAEEPMLCPSLKAIAFFDCNVDRRVIEDLEEVVAKRKKSTVAWLHRVVIIRRTGALPDHRLIHRLRRSVPCVDARIDEKLPDLS